MKPEPLRGQTLTMDSKGGWHDNEYFDKNAVKSAVEFYKKYKNKPITFDEDFEEQFNDFCKNILKWKDEKLIYKDMEYIQEYEKEEFNDWLFDYCFGDVIG